VLSHGWYGMLIDASLTVASVKTRILLCELEARLRYDVLPDGHERDTIREKIEMCELVLNCLNGKSHPSSPDGGIDGPQFNSHQCP
jgi:hypothetical protein